MKNNNLILGCVFLSLVVVLSSCDKDDDNNPVELVGMITLDMAN